MQQTKQAFSLVEILITISIVIIIGVVSITSLESVSDKSNNAKIVSDIETLGNAFKASLQEIGEYPMPKGNLKFYGEDTGYIHTYEESFGVSGFVTDDIVEQKYLNQIPREPRTNQYYAYAKTTDTENYEIAGVMFEKNIPSAFVSGDWKGEFGPYHLVREYAGPNFVYNKGLDHFPYNPYESLLIAKIHSYSGTLLINNTIKSQQDIFAYSLLEGDKITISTGGTVEIYYSDGSNSVLGDTLSQSEIVLEKMNFVEESNLFTSIKIALNVGSLWTKASKLSDKSNIEIDTTDLIAAVRGTIFGMRQETGNSDIVMIQGKIEVAKPGNIPLIVPKVTHMVGTKSFISVPTGSGTLGIHKDVSGIGSNTGAIQFLPLRGKKIIIDNIPVINNNIPFETIAYNKEKVVLEITPTLQQAEKIIFQNMDTMSISGIINNSGSIHWSNTGVLVLTGSQLGGSPHIINGKYQFSFCNTLNGKDICTKEREVNITPEISFDQKTQYISYDTDLTNLYKKFFNRGYTITEDKSIKEDIVSIRQKLVNNTIRKQNKKNIKKGLMEIDMTGNDCIEYQKRNRILKTGYNNCQPIETEIGDQTVQNILAGKGYEVFAYAGYNSSESLNMTLSGNRLITPNSHISSGTSGGGGGSPLDSLSFDGVRNYNTGSSFAIMKNNTKGIFMYNNYNWGNESNYIVYTNTGSSGIGLGTGSEFAIEMSVRGTSLKRNVNSPGNTLFSLNHEMSLNTGMCGMYPSPQKSCLKFGASSSFSGLLLTSDLTGSLDDQKFYKILVEYKSGTGVISLYDEYKLMKKSEDISINNSPWDSWEYFLLGFSGNCSSYGGNFSCYPYNYWNDIIDYLKIYKKSLPKEDTLNIKLQPYNNGRSLEIKKGIGGDKTFIY